MADWIRRVLTRRRPRASRAVEEPDERLVYVVKFALGMTGFLTAIEIAHLALLRTWNSEVFAAITGLIGTVSGILIGQKA
jgi:hypothetical protein